MRAGQHDFKVMRADADRMAEADRRFFKRHPDRKHRVRLASSSEAELLMKVYGHGTAACLPDGFRWFVCVRQIDPRTSTRIRVLIPGQQGIETDASEVECARLFDTVRAQLPEVGEAEIAARRLAGKVPP